MYFNDRTFLCLSLIILLNRIVISSGQNFWKITDIQDEKPEDKRIKIIWCTISVEEQHKCNNFAMANERDHIQVGYDLFKLECYQASTKDECMKLLDAEQATLTTLDAAQVFVGGRYNSLVPILQEVLEGGFRHYYTVAVVKKDTLPDVHSLYDLRGKKACFAGVESFAGWVLPIYTLMKEGGMDIIDCNNHVKSATNFFGPSCAVNCLTDRYNPIGDNSDKLCELCIGRYPGSRCTDSDPYAGFTGAFRCLLETGDIAFLRHTTIPELLSGNEFLTISKDAFELLCKDGSRQSIDNYLACNWGKVPSNAVVTTSASSYELRRKYQLFLDKASKLYPKMNTTTNYTRHDDNRNYYGDNPYRDQPEYDSLGNRIDRFKRQSFGDYNQQQQQQQSNRSQYNQQNPNDYNRYNPNQYGRDNPYGSDTDDRNRQQNPYSIDPYAINRDRYGDNIDPYIERDQLGNPIQTTQNQTIYQFDRNLNQTNSTFYEVFSLFESSPRYGIHGNLIFQDSIRSFASLGESQQTYGNYLGDSLNIIMGLRDCQINRMTLCVTSDVEKDKCIKMKTALKAQLLKPEMDCYKGHSQIHCMQAIRSGTADVAVLDASDVYTAGLQYELVPFISEMYNLETPDYYVVAVAKESDPSTELTYLKNKNTCHGGISTAAGWVYPLAFLISNGWIRPYGCNSIRAAAEYFSKSCVPGALSAEYNTGVPYDNMCDLCHGASYRYCHRDASEDYYGHTGAFRCLVEGGGHVAFVKHTTVFENTGGKREEWWARDNLYEDFELLCPDGTRREINQYTECNLGKVKANAIVTRGGYDYNQTHINAYINLFLYAQTFYGRKATDEFSFSMFSSPAPYTDLIFQDATTQLKVIEPDKRYYAAYLGSDFMRARRIVDCHAGSINISASFLLLISSNLIVLFILKF